MMEVIVRRAAGLHGLGRMQDSVGECEELCASLPSHSI